MATITVEIASVDRSSLVQLAHRISWERDANGQGQARFVLSDSAGGFVPGDGQDVVIKEDGTARFGGLINGRPRQFHGPDLDRQLYDISVGDYALILNKRHVWRKYTDTAFEDIVSDIHTDFLSSEGVTLDVTAGTKHTVTFNGEKVAEALDILCELEADGRTWRMDPGKVLVIETLSESPAPATLDKTTVLDEVDGAQKPTVEPDRSTYANTVTVIGGGPDFAISYTARDTAEIAARAAAEGGSGIYEHVEEVPEAKDAAMVQAAAEGILEKRKLLRQRFVGTTRTSGFAAGQQVTVNIPEIGLSSVTMFIESVSTATNRVANEFWHTVTAITGDPDGGWQSYYRRERKKPRTIPMQVEAAPGLVRVNSEAGALVHDPDRDPMTWSQGTTSGALAATPSAIGITHRRQSGVGSGNFMVTVRRDTAPTPDEQVLEMWTISAAEVPGTTAARTYRWEEFAANANFKDRIVVDPTSTYAAGVQHGAPGTLFVVGMNGQGLLGSVASNLSDQANAGDPVWVGDYLYIPNVNDGVVRIYNMTDPTAPTETAAFTTSLSKVFSIVANAAGTVLYFCGTGGFTAADISASPTSPGPTANSGSLQLDVDATAGTFTRSAGDFTADGFAAGQSILGSGFANAGNNTYFTIQTVTATVITVVDNTGMVTETGSGDEQLDAIEDARIETSGSYVSHAINGDDTRLAAAVRVNAANVRVVTLNVATAVLTLNAEVLVALAQTNMEGEGAVYEDDALIVFRDRNGDGNANSLKAYIFNLKDPSAPTVTATLSYTHAATGNLGPARSTHGRKVLYTFGFNSGAQVTHGSEALDKVVPYTIGAANAGGQATRPVPPRFGGSGLTEYQRGNVLAATGHEDLAAVDPPGAEGLRLVSDSGEASLVRWSRMADDLMLSDE